MIPVTYDYFDSDDKEIPPRSDLYNLEPIGIGTHYVESLTSYISRLAEYHNLKVSTLVGKVFKPFVKKHYLKKTFKTGGFGSTTRYINGNSPVSLEYVSILEELTTRQDLIYLTMNSWTGIFPNNTVGDTRKWCPSCLEEWRGSDRRVYEPLIWYIKDVNICDRHRVKLEDKCRNCGKELQFLHSNLNVGYCQYCGNWLGEKVEKGDGNLPLNKEVFTLNNYKTLVEKAPSLKHLPISNKIGLVLQKTVENNNLNSITQFAKFLGFHQVTVNNWAINKCKPSTESTLEICNKLNVSIFEMFCTDVNEKINVNVKNNARKKQRGLKVQEIEIELKNAIKNRLYMSLHKLSIEKGFSYGTAKVYFPDLCEKITQEYLKHKDRVQSLQKEKIKKVLISALELETPVSFKQLTINAGISIKSAKKYHPDLVNKVISRFLSYRSEMKEERDDAITKEIRKVVLEMHKRGEYPGIKTVQNNLSDPKYFMKEQFREAWKSELTLLGYKK